jgi:starch synthase
MRILLASSEVYPYSKTGGLADAVGALGKALAKSGHQVGIVTPLYRGIRERFPKIQKADWRFDLPLGPKRVSAELWVLEGEGLTIYFIHQPEYFDRAGCYGENGADYGDNGERFIFFDKCVTHLARFLPWRPEVLHVHDWHTGLVPLMVSHQARAEGWAQPPRLCLTIHNLAYQGCFSRNHFALTNLPGNCFTPDTAEFYGQLNCLKAGIAGAEVITTVSPRYAREITTQELGAGLDGLLRKRHNSLVGILNGVDYEEWNTNANPHLPASYSAADMTGKARCKRALQAEFALTIDSATPIFGCVTRLADQKGMDLALGALEELLAAEMQFVLLGSGTPECERAFQDLAQRFPGRVGVRLGYDQALAHRIEAGSDFYLMPSRFEPCGLNQMYSLRYGTVPIVRRTGGLDDTVVDAMENPTTFNGIKFSDCSVNALARAMRKALVLFQDPELLTRYRRNGMAAEFSWDQAVSQYLAVYRNP